MVHIDVAIAERARKQLGLLTTAQLIELGVTRAMRRTRLGDGRLIRVSPNVYRLPAFPVSWHQQVLAAVLEGGLHAAAAFMAAAALSGFDGIGTGAVEIIVPRNRRPVGIKGRVHWTIDFRPGDITRAGLIPCTSPERTLVDIAPRLTRSYLEQAVDGAARDGLIDAARLVRRIEAEAAPGWRRLDVLLDVLRGARLTAETESWLESRTMRIFMAAGLPVPRVQVEFDDAGRVIRVDFFFEDAKLVVEVLGHRTHSTRRQLAADAERRAALTLRGYEVIEFTYDHVRYRPGYVSTTTASHLAMRMCA